VRVAQVYKDVYPPVAGGIERHIDSIRRFVPGVEHEVLACARGWRTKKRTTAAGTEVLVGEFGRVLSAPLAPAFPVWLARRHPDLVHLHMPNPTGEVSALLALPHTPMVVTYHADVVRQAFLNPVYRPVVESCLRRASKVIVSSRRLVDRSRLLARWRDKVAVVPFAVDTDHFDPGSVSERERADVRRRFGSPLIVSVGRLVYYKGFEQLIAASKDLDATVLIVGSGPMEDRLRSLARDLPRVQIVGEASEHELLTYLAAADCFVLPSTSHAEAFGIATLEAQAMGVPAVVTDVGTATVEAIDPQRSGFVVPPGSPAEIAAACRRILGDEVLRRRMGEAGRRHVLARHSPPTFASRLKAVYAEACSLRQ
jgi:rhamnosyl/mannosyltransferase